MRPPDGAGTAPICGRAFGIDIESSFPIPCVPQFSLNGSARTRVQLMSADDLNRMWRAPGAEMIIDRRLVDGRRLMTIEHDAKLGYRIWASRFGRHIVSNDGLSVSTALPPVSEWRWQRLLFAQVLPLAAALRGLDPFHASAVAIGGRAVAFVASSGSGKTSVAAHLVAQGASFMTDDVLSLQFNGTDLLAHPGPAMTSIAPNELLEMSKEERRRLGPTIGRELGKKHFRPAVVDSPHPVGAFVFLNRHADVDRLSIEPITNPDPRLLLSSSFISYLRTQEHLLVHLDTCAQIAQSVPVYELRIPAESTARGAAELVRDRFEAST